MFSLQLAEHRALIAEERRREAAVHHRPRRPKEARRPIRPARET